MTFYAPEFVNQTLFDSQFYSKESFFNGYNLRLLTRKRSWQCDLVTGVNFLIPLIRIMCISIINIPSLVHDIKSKQVFLHNCILTLTFDLVTLTWGQLQHLIVINHVCKYHQYPIIGLWYIVDSIFYTLTYMTLTFDLVTLTFGQLQHLIYTYQVFKYHLYLIIGSW